MADKVIIVRLASSDEKFNAAYVSSVLAAAGEAKDAPKFDYDIKPKGEAAIAPAKPKKSDGKKAA